MFCPAGTHQARCGTNSIIKDREIAFKMSNAVRLEEWLFDQAPNVAAIITRHVLESNCPLLLVIHYDDDHSWAFCAGQQTTQKMDGSSVWPRQ
jgi:hypothetical protein